MSIEKIWAREILDSRGNPTVEVDLHTAKGDGLSIGPTCPELGLARAERSSFKPRGARPVSQGWMGVGGSASPGFVSLASRLCL